MAAPGSMVLPKRLCKHLCTRTGAKISLFTHLPRWLILGNWASGIQNSRKASSLSCVAICVLRGSPALLVIGLRPTLRTGFCEALVLGLKRFVGRSWVQNVTVKTAFRSHWLRVGVRSSLLHQKCGRAGCVDQRTTQDKDSARLRQKVLGTSAS